MNHYPTIAYICLEFGLSDQIKTYAGGLGILAGDTIKTAADLNLPFTGLGLLYKDGYFKQVISSEGLQQAENDTWEWTKYLEHIKTDLPIRIGETTLYIDVYCYHVQGESGTSPLYLADFDKEQNPEMYRNVSRRLYSQDDETKRLQQILLGYASLRIYEEMYGNLPEIVHINESHAAYSILYLLKTLTKDQIRGKFVFTTHTPILAGHEVHSINDVKALLGEDITRLDPDLTKDGVLNLSQIAIHYSKYTNAVSKKHGEVSSKMFPGAPIDSITNGVHPQTWISKHFQDLYDEFMKDWRLEPQNLRKALTIPSERISQAHSKAKSDLNWYLGEHSNTSLDPSVFTIGFARRSAFYKRNDLILTDFERLRTIARKFGSLQLVFAGKAHPNDQIGQSYIKKIVDYARSENDTDDGVRILFMPDYGIEISKLLVAGVDLWLNNPIVPLEASGTSGMKASMNGVPSFSTLDGWWIEGCFEGLSGWEIGGGCEGEACTPLEIKEMYDKLENTILPIFYENKEQWLSIQKHSIALNGSYFNTKRMMQEYLLKAYLRG